MAKFAKLFERGEHQVLVTKGYNDDEEAVLTLQTKTRTSGHSLKIDLVVKKGPNAKTLEESLDHAFNSIDEALAFDTIESSPGINL